MDQDRLYGLPLEQFVTERDSLASRLRRQGRREEAARVAKLPKPTLAAWGANQALRSQPRTARELRTAGSALVHAQRTALRGQARQDELRSAVERHRAALGEMMQAASGLLDGNGRGLRPATLERVRQTLAAASLDPDLAEQAEQGRLTHEHFFTGLGEVATSREVTPTKAQASAPGHGQRGSTRHRDAARERRVREAARKRRAAQLKAARGRLGKAKKTAAVAAKARDSAAREARTAQAAHERAERRLAKALEEQARAQAQLETLENADEK